jgi:hypothetical protein
MKQVKFTVIAALLGLALISACNLQIAGPPTGDAVGSAIAKTIVAQTDLAKIVAGTLAAMVTDTPLFTLTPSLTPSSTPTPTPPMPMVSVSMDTNCRTGPGKVYDMSGSLLVGQTAEVLGRSSDSQYWVIRDPKDPSNICWLWGFYATVTGNTGILPAFTPPPTPTPAATNTPAASFSFSYVDITHCGASYAFRFQVKNNGSVTWESVRLVVTDNTTATTFTHILNSFRSYNGCGVEVNQQELMPGEGGHVANILPGEMGYNPAGHSITTTATLCSQNGLGGTCISKTINFNP